MAKFGYFQPDSYGAPVVKHEVDADYMDNPGAGETVQLYSYSKNSSEADQLVAVFRIGSGEFVKLI